jgi:hypothetical protein
MNLCGFMVRGEETLCGCLARDRLHCKYSAYCKEQIPDKQTPTEESRMVVQKPFWKVMCSSDDKIRAMSKRHDNPDEALERCVELARRNPGAEFYVMKAEYRVKCNDVTVEKLGVNK